MQSPHPGSVLGGRQAGSAAFLSLSFSICKTRTKPPFPGMAVGKITRLRGWFNQSAAAFTCLCVPFSRLTPLSPPVVMTPFGSLPCSAPGSPVTSPSSPAHWVGAVRAPAPHCLLSPARATHRWSSVLNECHCTLIWSEGLGQTMEPTLKGC